MGELWPEYLSKAAQLSRSPGGNRYCPTTKQLKRTCKCHTCLGTRNQRKGGVKQRQARKRLEKAFGGQAGSSVMVTANEENWRLPVRSEVKSGPIGNPVDTFYRNQKAQSDRSKAIGDTRPFMAVAMPDGTTDGLAVIRLSELEQVVVEVARKMACE